MRQYFQVLAVVFAILIPAACSKSPQDQTFPANVDDPAIRVGGLYVSQYEDGKWHVSKVLAFDGDVVHVRMYANTFAEQPRTLDPSKLTLGSVGSPDGFGIGHAPIAKEGFLSEKHLLVMVTAVTADEFDGYRYYLDAMRDSR